MSSHSLPPSSPSIRLAAWVLLALLTLALAEIAVRIVFPLPEVRNFDRISFSPHMVSAPLLGQATLAHATIRIESEPDGAVSLHELNLNGFRDGEWSVAKARKRRILMVGDSMVEGFLAGPDETIPKVFERAARTAGEDLEVWNMGVGGAGLEEYVRLIQDAVPAYAPDEIFLVFHANDLLGSVTFGPTHVKPSFEARQGRFWESRLAGVIIQALRHEPLARRWHAQPFGFFAAVPDPSNPWTSNGAHYASFVRPDIAEAMRRGRFNPFNVDEVHGFARHLPNPVDPGPWLKFIKDFLDARGVELLLAYIPQTNQTTDYYLPFRQQFCSPAVPSLTGPAFQAGAAAVAQAARGLAIPFLDLTPALRAAEARGEHMYWQYDEHLRPAGYAFVARMLHEWRMQIGSN